MRTTLLAGFLLLSGALLFGQTPPTANDISVFRIPNTVLNLPEAALAGTDRQIRNVFLNLGSFRVTKIDERLTQDEAAKLVERLREYETSGAEKSASSTIGTIVLTSAEMQGLSQSLMIVVPVVDSYDSKRTASGEFTAELEIGFTIISGTTASVLDHFPVKTIGVGATAEAATMDALAAVAGQLVYEARTLPHIHPAPEIVEIGSSMVLIEMGRNSGVHVGEEFAVFSSHELASGRVLSERTGLLLVKEVKEKIAYARVIYADSPLRVGDRLRRIVRIGFESSIYVHAVAATQPQGSTFAPVFTVGTMHTVTHGLYNLRPVIGFEAPIAVTSIGGSDSYSGSGLPMNVYVGAELNWRLWRFDIVPLAAIGIGGVLPFSTTARVSVSVGGGLAQVSASYLITSRFKVYADVGLEEWFPLGATSLTGWGGFYGGLGLTIAY